MSRILVIEDDPAISRGLVDNLTFEGYDVTAFDRADEGQVWLQSNTADLIVLDVMLPGMSGYDLCRRLRQEGNSTLILMLTARGQEFDRVMGLDLGADDYVTKPFSVLELMARIRALLRRKEPESELPDTLSFADIEVDFLRFEATKNGESLGLSRKEFGLLRELASKPGQVFSRDELLNRVWGYENYPSTRTVDNHVSMLRGKIEDDPASPEFLVTMHGVGYKLTLPEAS